MADQATKWQPLGESERYGDLNQAAGAADAYACPMQATSEIRIKSFE